MRLLITRAVRGLVETVGDQAFLDQLGILVTPRSGYSVPSLLRLMEAGSCWGGDNDAYSAFSRAAFIRMLKQYQYVPNCLFIAAPDVVGDAVATQKRFELWCPVLRHYGYPVALVAQDGLETLPIDWDSFEVLFIGGTTKWKLGRSAALLVKEAKARGKRVHMGRVNSNRRINYASAIGCDTCDGTNYSKFTRTSLPKALPALNSHNLRMEGF